MNSQRKQMLQGSIDYLKHDARMPSMANAFSELMDDYEKLQSRIEALEKDAARLDWLESSKEMHAFCHTGYDEYRYYAHQADGFQSVRDTIDTAMQKD